MICLDSNCVVNFIGKNRLKIYHPFYRKNVLVSANVSPFLDALSEGAQKEQIIQEMNESGQKYSFANVTDFNLWEGMYNNPNYMAEQLDVDLKQMNAEELIAQLSELGFLSSGNNGSYNLAKQGVFDRFKGNVNEQIATESLFRKVPIADWWKQQKFKNEDEDLSESAYKYIQAGFLKDYFQKNLNGKDVLEIGCGTGFYSLQMAEHARKVYGLDYEEQYIEKAKQKAKDQQLGNVQFLLKNICEDFIDPELKGKKFDYIFMIDFFLFFFDQKFQKVLVENRDAVFQRIKTLLKDDGVLVILDPHLFWLIPRMGRSDKPYGLISEYKNRVFGVTPTLEESTALFSKAGFAIQRIIEPGVDEALKEHDVQGYHFFDQFPQWIVFELIQKR